MVTGVEGIGEAVTGGMLAHAVEPGAGSVTGEHGANCLNCGAALQGEFCHRCGQSGHVHRTVGAFWHDIAHSVFHFDGKMWRTLPLLAWHPGQLTRRYIHGERAKFVSQMAIFLFSVFLMFAVVHSLGGPFGAVNFSGEGSAEAQQEYRQERAEALKELDHLKKQRAQAVAGSERAQELDSDIRSAETSIRVQDKVYKKLMERAAAQAKRHAEPGGKKWVNPVLKGQQAREAKAAGKVDPGAIGIGSAEGEDGKLDIRTGIPFVDAGLKKAGENPSLLLYKLQSNAYKFSWALILISVPFVWLMFLHRRRYRQYKAYDHIVFVTYSIAFMSIGFIALTLLKPLGAPEAIAGTVIAFGPPIHMYRQLRGAYELSRFSALWRTALLVVFAFVAGTLFVMLLLALGALD